MEGIQAKEEIAAKKSCVNYGFYIGATPENAPELAKATNVPDKIHCSSTGNRW